MVVKSRHEALRLARRLYLSNPKVRGSPKNGKPCEIMLKRWAQRAESV
jgi:hypothetical protein